MNVLLDECLPRRLKKLLQNHKCATAQDMGWAGKKNGELLQLAQERFDVFITSDRNLSYQQNLSGARIALIVLVANSNRFAALQTLVPDLLVVLETIRPGEVIQVRRRSP